MCTVVTHKLAESHKADRRFAKAKEERERRQAAKDKQSQEDKDAPVGTLLDDVGIPNVYLWEVRNRGPQIAREGTMGRRGGSRGWDKVGGEREATSWRAREKRQQEG